MIRDLSVPITDGTDWYHEAGSIPVSLQQVGSYEEGWVSHQMSMMVINGTTYLETGAHLYPDQPTLDQMPLERFITRAFIVDVGCPAIRSGKQIICSLPSPRHRLKDFRPDQDAILLSCGWDRHMNEDDYYSASPYFSAELQEWLLDHRPSILGGDMLSYDHPQDAAMPFLRTFFRGGGMILCPLIGLDDLPGQVMLHCAPLKLIGSSAAPCRALALT